MIEEQIEKAVEVLSRGGLIIYPTDTVWGIGCDATNAAAVERINILKRSQGKQGMIVLVQNMDRAALYSNAIPEVAWQLLEFADKPLTLILPGGCGVAENLIADDGSIAIRIPDHVFCQGLLRKFRKPIVSTSANISGEATPSTLAEISKTIIDGVDFIVYPAVEGKPTRRASSMIKLGKTGEIKIIRE